jgi:hypothetical protein
LSSDDATLFAVSAVAVAASNDCWLDSSAE